MTGLSALDRLDMVMDAIDRMQQTGDKGIYLKQQLKDKLIEHKQYINKHGQDMPEIRNWKWVNRSCIHKRVKNRSLQRKKRTGPPSTLKSRRMPYLIGNLG